MRYSNTTGHNLTLCLLVGSTLAVLFAAHTATADEPAQVPQAWKSSGTQYDNTDSLAACRVGNAVHVFATSKDGDRIDIFNGATGAFIRAHGQTGTAPGQFRRPNGVVVVEFGRSAPQVPPVQTKPVVMVIERDNDRVQGFWPTDLSHAVTFGTGELHRPYGGAVSYRPDGPFLYVTDTNVSPDQVVKVYRLAFKNGEVRAKHIRTFGETSGPGQIGEAESIIVDDEHGHVLLCDEVGKNVKVYSATGDFTGKTFGDGLVGGDPEGIAVYDHADGGFVILTDQRPSISIFHVFQRKTYDYIGAFTGTPNIANTDGICLYPSKVGDHPAGMLYAVHDDADVRAYSIKQIHAAIKQMRSGE